MSVQKRTQGPHVSQTQKQKESVLQSIRDVEKKMVQHKSTLEAETRRLSALQKLAQRHQATLRTRDDHP